MLMPQRCAIQERFGEVPHLFLNSAAGALLD
jgi:hypothetical protein